jgi:Tol biopolymer transport system component
MASGAAGGVTWLYRSRLSQAADQVGAVARLEARAIAANDKISFMAVQDADDDTWRSAQSQRFARLERDGLPEFGWKATGAAPQPGAISLEPGGARLDVTYRFFIAQPMPGGPVSVTLAVPQYYRQTPSGWVRAMPAADFWGAWRKQVGKTTAVVYVQRDAAVIEPLAPRLDEIMRRMCDTLPCPARLPITFETDIGALSRLGTFSYGYDVWGLKLPSPQWIGLPADAASRDELYRAYETRLAQALVYEASDKKLDLRLYAPQEFVRWQLAQAGLTGPFINEAITRTLGASSASVRLPLAAIQLRSTPVRLELRPGQIAVPLAFEFLEQKFGPGTVSRLLPALTAANVRTLGEAITMILRVNPATLEPAWQDYVRRWEDTVSVVQSAPEGELALWCAPETSARAGSVIMWMKSDGTDSGVIPDLPAGGYAWPPHWSPDGQALAYAQGDNVAAQVVVMDLARRTSKIVAEGLTGAPWVEWLPGSASRRLQIAGMTTRVVDLDTGTRAELVGTRHTWSPDGRWLAYQSPYPNPVVWLAAADGSRARQVGWGDKLAWSPDSTRLAYFGLPSRIKRFFEREVHLTAVAQPAANSITVLARDDDLVQLLTGGVDETSSLTDLAWSPDGALLAVGVAWSSGTAVVVLDPDTGALRARWQWGWTRVGFPATAWSPDNRHLVVWLAPDSSAASVPNLLDVQTGAQHELSGTAFDWSPDGRWLALTQAPTGLLMLRPDWSASRWLETPACFDVAWRPTGQG